MIAKQIQHKQNRERSAAVPALLCTSLTALQGLPSQANSARLRSGKAPVGPI